MDTSFGGNVVCDFSLDHENLASAMYETGSLCNGFGEYGMNDLMPAPESTTCNTINELTMEVFGCAQYGEYINPDDFLNDVLKSEPASSDTSSPSRRETPSPSGSQQSYESVPSFGGFDGCHVVPMHLESPPISPQTPVSPSEHRSAETSLKPAAKTTSNESKTISGLAGLRRVKVVPKSTIANVTRTITKKTIVLSAKDYNALMANIQRQPTSNTSILLKANSTKKLPIMAGTKEVDVSSACSRQDKPAVLPKLQSTSSRAESTRSKERSPAVDTTESSQEATSFPIILPSGTNLFEQKVDEKLLKKHQRMIKNRQSAYMSRVKKKEYVTSLEEHIQKLTDENEHLRMENANLLERLKMHCSCGASKLLIGNSSAKQVSPAGRKNAAIVLAMVFMVSLNFYPIGNLLANNDRVELHDATTTGALEYRSRGLLWANETTDRVKRTSYHLNMTALDELTKTDSARLFPAPECPFYVNQTENIRLAGELRRWIGENGYKNLTDSKGGADLSIDTFDRMFRLKDAIDSMYRHMKDISVQMKTFERRQKQTLSAKERQRKRKHVTGGQREVTPYRGKLGKQHDLELYYPSVNIKYAEFFEEIGRRDDTFYLVSFSEEHLLLPALAYNKTNRPRMSLMLPTIAAPSGPMRNSTDRSEKITLMQIDCEVMNTSVIQIREKKIPGDLRPQGGSDTPKGAGAAGKAYGGGRNATTTASAERSSRTNVNTTMGRNGRLLRELRSSFSSSEQSRVTHAIERKGTAGQHQHGPSRPFFVERMNEHLKSEHHVN